MGIGNAQSLFESVVGLHDRLGWEWEKALAPATETPARILKLSDVGRLAENLRADAIVSDGHRIIQVVAGGRLMVDQGRPCVWGTFESHRQAN